MALLPASVDLTDLDFDALRARLRNLIRAAFPEWTDESTSNFGNILVELQAHVGDVLAYYLDNHARESRIATATQRRSLIGLAKLLSYEPAGASAATADVLVTLRSVPAANVVIPQGTRVRTLSVTNPVEFQTTADLTIVAPATTGTVAVEHSRSRSETFTASGLAYQALTLGFTPYLDASINLTADNGAFTEVDNLLSSTSTDRDYTISVDQNDRARVRFGNGINGQLPTGTITVNYKTGGGTLGNVQADTLVRMEGSFTDLLSNPVSILSCTNAAAASGGADRETAEQIRLQAPASLRALTRSVAREDFETHAKNVSGVARALMVTRNELTGLAENTGRLYIVPSGGGTPSSLLLSNVTTQVTVTFPPPVTFTVTVLAPVYKTIDITAQVWLRAGANPSVVDAAIRTALGDLFAIELDDGSPNPLIDFGYYYQNSAGTPDPALPYSDVYNAIRDVDGVRKIEDGSTGLLLNDAALDVALSVLEFPILGEISILNAETGLALA